MVPHLLSKSLTINFPLIDLQLISDELTIKFTCIEVFVLSPTPEPVLPLSVQCNVPNDTDQILMKLDEVLALGGITC